MLKGDRATPSLILLGRVQRSWKCKNILCGRECTVRLPDGRTILLNTQNTLHGAAGQLPQLSINRNKLVISVYAPVPRLEARLVKMGDHRVETVQDC